MDHALGAPIRLAREPPGADLLETRRTVGRLVAACSRARSSEDAHEIVDWAASVATLAPPLSTNAFCHSDRSGGISYREESGIVRDVSTALVLSELEGLDIAKCRLAFRAIFCLDRDVPVDE